MARFLVRAGHEHVGRPLQRSIAVFLLVGVGFCALLVARLAVWFWRTSLVLTVVLALMVVYGRWAPVLVCGGASVAVLGWRFGHRSSYSRLVVPWWRAWWRRWVIYAPRWPRLARRHRLVVRDRDAVDRSRLRKVRCTPAVDRLLIRIPAGLAPADFEAAAISLAHATKTDECRIRPDRPGQLWVELLRRDSLRAEIPALPIPEAVDLYAVPVGVAEDGLPWRLRLLGTHVLIAGATGAGKGAILWSLLRGLAPGIRSGLVEPWVLDPKGGMELSFGEPMFARFEATDPDAMADALDECVEFMDARARHLAGYTRLHAPTVAEPFRLVLIDELATLTAFSDRTIARRIERSLGLLLTKGRAVGVSVVAALQDPGKDVIPYRNLFPTRVALRLDEAVEVDMVLGDGARDRGAWADHIPESLPGVGYVRIDGNREATRVRAAYPTDEDIKAMAAGHAWPRRLLRPVDPDEGVAA
jgi:S-DNA-T family DNA segregation ATPase FtsK/SpoIIIE